MGGQVPFDPRWESLFSYPSLESFPEKPSWCRSEQVCQGVKCKAL